MKSSKPCCCPKLVLPTRWPQTLFLLAVRLYWGWQFFETGKGKLSHIPKITEFFTKLHIPLPKLNAYVAGSTECFGGLLLLLGVGSRLISIPLAFTMCVAYGTAHLETVQAIFQKPDDFVTAPPFLFLFACLIVVLFGPGKISVDAWIQRKFCRDVPKD